jgi:hypothetical protein
MTLMHGRFVSYEYVIAGRPVLDGQREGTRAGRPLVKYDV